MVENVKENRSGRRQMVRWREKIALERHVEGEGGVGENRMIHNRGKERGWGEQLKDDQKARKSINNNGKKPILDCTQ